MGLMIHMSYCILGIATIISSSPIAWHILKTIGAYYLIYLAYKLIKPYTMNQEEGAKRKEIARSHSLKDFSVMYSIQS